MKNNNGDVAPLLKALFAVVVWGASFIATKIALRDIQPATLIWLRFAVGLAVIGAFIAIRKESIRISRGSLASFAVLGFFGIALHQWLQATGLITAQASTTAWIVSTIPVFIAILGWLALRETLGVIRTGGIVLAMAGVLLVVAHGDLRGLLMGQSFGRGDLLILLSAPNWAVFTILSRKVLQRHPAMVTMFYVMLTGWVYTSVLFFAENGIADLAHITLSTVMSLGFLGILCTGIAYAYWYDALKVVPAARIGSLLYVEPLVAVVVAALLLHEPILLAVLLGGVMILAGVWMVNRPERKRASPP